MNKVRCPIEGCPKKGAPSALAAHAKVKHPEISSRDYQAMLDGGPLSASGPSLALQPTRTTRARPVLMVMGIVFVSVILVGLVAYVSLAI